MNSKDVGNLGEHIAIVECLRLGVQVSRPLGDNSRYDLILDVDNKLYSVQVKSNNQENKEYVEFLLYSKNVLTQETSTYTVDLFILVDITNNLVFGIKNTVEYNKSLRLRYTKAQGSNTKSVKYAENFLLEDLLKTLAPD